MWVVRCQSRTAPCRRPRGDLRIRRGRKGPKRKRESEPPRKGAARIGLGEPGDNAPFRRGATERVSEKNTVWVVRVEKPGLPLQETLELSRRPLEPSETSETIRRLRSQRGLGDRVSETQGANLGPQRRTPRPHENAERQSGGRRDPERNGQRECRNPDGTRHGRDRIAPGRRPPRTPLCAGGLGPKTTNGSGFGSGRSFFMRVFSTFAPARPIAPLSGRG